MHVAKCHTFQPFFVTLNIVQMFCSSITMLLANFYFVSCHVLSNNVNGNIMQVAQFSLHLFGMLTENVLDIFPSYT